MYWSYILTAGGILGIYLAGKKNLYGWAIGLSMQVLWIIYAVQSKQYGFIFSGLAYGAVYGRNWYLWHRDAPEKEKSRKSKRTELRQTAGQKDCPSSYEVKLQKPPISKEEENNEDQR